MEPVSPLGRPEAFANTAERFLRAYPGDLMLVGVWTATREWHNPAGATLQLLARSAVTLARHALVRTNEAEPLEVDAPKGIYLGREGPSFPLRLLVLSLHGDLVVMAHRAGAPMVKSANRCLRRLATAWAKDRGAP